MDRVVLLNTSILTSEGVFILEKISLQNAKELIDKNIELLSAIGHESTANILSDLLGINVPVNRINYTQEVNDLCIVFKLKNRAPEGVILSREEIENIGYDFFLLVKQRKIDPLCLNRGCRHHSGWFYDDGTPVNTCIMYFTGNFKYNCAERKISE